MLASTAAFRGGNPHVLQRLEEAVARVRLAPGQVLYASGDEDDNLYVVVSGTLRVNARLPDGTSRPLPPLKAGDIDGESAVLFRTVRTTTVAATTESEIWKLPAGAVAAAVAEDPPLYRRLVELASRKVLIAQLTAMPLFEGTDLDLVGALGGDGHWRRLAGGETLFRQGDPPDFFYVVVHGRLEVLVNQATGASTAAVIGPGECVGEMALLTGEPRSADVRAVRDSELACLSQAEFDRLLGASPRAPAAIARTLVSRLRDTTARGVARRGVSAIALIPCTAEALPPRFVDRFVQTLEGLGRTARVIRQRVEAELGGERLPADGESLPSAALRWLNDQETRNEYVVFVGDTPRSSWSHLCARQADVVLLVSAADADPAFADDERGPAQSHPRPTHLVLVHEDGTRMPSGTARWFDGRRLDAHHHVRQDHAGDFARLARVVTGRAVGVVFGGGGARGYLHLGVIRALREAGVPMDAVGGTSMGALAAAQCARDLTTAEIIEVATTGLGKQLGGSILKETTLPLVAFLSGRRTVRMLDQVFGDTRIEDLWLPYFCVSANLTTAEAVVHERGPLAMAIRASLSVPGILPPVVIGGHMLVDGGLLDNLPVDAMRKRAGTVVAIDVASAARPPAGVRDGSVVSGWAQLWARMNPFGRAAPVPTIFEILNRATTLGAVHSAERVKHTADLYLHPSAPALDMFDWKAGRSAIDAGYRYAAIEIERWKARTASERPGGPP